METATTAREGDRRGQLAEAATDHVLAHGLIGLSLRPLAAALGTSDRMLLYHFSGKDDLVATVLHTSNERSVGLVRSLPAAPSVRETVIALWEASTTQGQLESCQRLYVEAAALGLLGKEPYASVVGESNRTWLRALADLLVRAGCSPELAPRAANLLDAALMGLQLDLPLDRGTATLEQSVADLADAVGAIAAAGQGSR
ncbi:TetR/AcrR family transcriptional regulator [Nocardioides nitrophenolicus]|uniref:TetR/AcrR family transcriptional regulator n=1 Tax=Nocardioides nitrophenolicus TaxID=60489 RepID=UPI0027DD13AB|nr:TetR/AcrR family transcriptional regulator [Nocardioides nitrophenolicus]MBM7518141.1 AcrR family transcriptional regulator [Nocardioides nitrophenolicus]